MRVTSRRTSFSSAFCTRTPTLLPLLLHLSTFSRPEFLCVLFGFLSLFIAEDYSSLKRLFMAARTSTAGFFASSSAAKHYPRSAQELLVLVNGRLAGHPSGETSLQRTARRTS